MKIRLILFLAVLSTPLLTTHGFADTMVSDIDGPDTSIQYKPGSNYWTGGDTNSTDALHDSSPATEEAWLKALLGMYYDDPTLNYIGSSQYPAGGKALNGYSPGFDWNYAVVKFGNYWVAYEDTGDDNLLTAGPFTIINPKGCSKNLGISHIDFFGSDTPVPEPASMLLLGLGLIGLAGIRRKIQK